MNTKNYAPILITVYDRLDHIQNCIKSLLECPEAKFSALYVASDAPANEQHVGNIEMVRSFLKTINGFKEVNLIFRPTNFGAVKNSAIARAEVFKKYDRLIRLEDDVIVGNGFLKFINNGLENYNNEPKVAYICAYLPPGVESEHQAPFFLRTMTPYGFGIWREKERNIENEFSKEKFKFYFSSIKFFMKYEKLNPHCIFAIYKIINNDWMPGDIARGIIMLKNNYLSLFPPTSISKSIGHDGSGVHSTINEKLQNQTISNENYQTSTGKPSAHNKNLELLFAKHWRTPSLLIKNYFFYFFMIKYPTLSFMLLPAKIFFKLLK